LFILIALIYSIYDLINDIEVSGKFVTNLGKPKKKDSNKGVNDGTDEYC